MYLFVGFMGSGCLFLKINEQTVSFILFISIAAAIIIIIIIIIYFRFRKFNRLLMHVL